MKLKGCLLVGIIGVVALVGIVAVYGIGAYNGLIGARQRVDSQWAQVENVYQRRADLIPNLVKTVEGAANFEKSTLTEITAARASVGQIKLTGAPDAQQLAEFERAQGGLGAALSRLLVVSERYPDLKANAGFLSLQTQLEGSENRISVERGRYNEVVQDYNTRILAFPTVFIARFMGFTERAYFKAKEGAEKPPVVEFGSGGKPAPR